MDAAAGVDRISDLPDDLLHVILGFLPNAIAASRTAVLSRRWRREWIHSQVLSFLDTKDDSCPDDGRWGRFDAVFVDWVLAQRGDAGLGSLSIDMNRSASHTLPERVNEWIRYAMQHVVESFCLVVPFVWMPYDSYGIDHRPRPVIQLPGHGRAMSICMNLWHHRLQLPVAAAAKFKALTELSISKVSFDEDDETALRSGCTLGDFVSSSCCPRLRKLEIISPMGLPQLVLRAEALEELLLSSAEAIRTLDVTAPKLRVLRLQLCVCNGNYSYNNTIDVARVRAPALEEIGVYSSPYRRTTLDICDLTSVRCLSDLHLDMHGQYCHRSDVALWLLENCPRVECISVWLHHWMPHGITTTTSMLIDLGADGAAPFARLTSMDLEACIFPRRHLVASVSSFLMRCPRLRLLRIHLIDIDPEDQWGTCICDDFDYGRGHKRLHLEYLELVKISGFKGAPEEMDLVRLFFESSKSINSMIIRIRELLYGDTFLRLPGEKCLIATVDQELVNIPSAVRGCWQFEACCATERATIWSNST